MREHIGLMIWLWILVANAALVFLSGSFGGSMPAGSYDGGRSTKTPGNTDFGVSGRRSGTRYLASL